MLKGRPPQPFSVNLQNTSFCYGCAHSAVWESCCHPLFPGDSTCFSSSLRERREVWETTWRLGQVCLESHRCCSEYGYKNRKEQISFLVTLKVRGSFKTSGRKEGPFSESSPCAKHCHGHYFILFKSSSKSCQAVIIICILQMRKLSLGMARELSQAHSAQASRAHVQTQIFIPLRANSELCSVHFNLCQLKKKKKKQHFGIHLPVKLASFLSSSFA